MSIDYKSVSEVEQSLIKDHLKEVNPKDEVGTMRQINKARRQAPAASSVWFRLRQQCTRQAKL